MPDGSQTPRIDRRGFLKVGAALGGGLALTIALPPLRPALAAAGDPAGFAPGAFIRIDRQGLVTLVMPMAEMGQGIYTAHAMMLAEELEVGLDQVRLEISPPNDALYANPVLHVQTTGLSTSIRAFWTPLPRSGSRFPRPTTRCTQIRCCTFRRRGSRPRSVPSGRRCARPARWPAPC